MGYVLLGLLGFVSLLIFDYCNLKNYGGIKKISGLGSLGILIFSGIMILLKSEYVQLPGSIRIMGGIMTFVWGFMLIYSLFLELPFVNTYGKEKHTTTLVSSGTYALCRHPGVIWFGLMFMSIFLWSGAMLMVYTCVLWTIMDIIHVYIQEKCFFHVIFSDYKEYEMRTPMLIPNKKSFTEFYRTVFR